MRTYQTPRDIDSLDQRDPALIARLARVLKPLLWSYFRPEIRGLDRIPHGAGVLVGNHNAALLMPEVFILGAALYERFGLRGLPFGMGHSTGIGLPLLYDLFVPIGAVRGSPANGRRILEAGGRLLIYPGGELDSMRSWWERERVIFGARRGYVRLAIHAGAPILPVVTAGAHETLIVLHNGRSTARWLGLDRRLRLKAWPVVLCLPWGLWPGIPPLHIPFRTRILMEVLAPIRFERQGAEAARDAAYVERCHERVHTTMEAALARLSAERREKGRHD